ncbi:hypothetical protein VPNG_06058 [Cytospora leucostoma]|uniref:SRR1-like domain-containing protein n=1 Tax=Cytospora leucostoma TaxID=1230097 RepID=A0A423WX31_9PEZI|nr:hypothetical protein VPNG_06058 [Cytospora leucostoma]
MSRHEQQARGRPSRVPMRNPHLFDFDNVRDSISREELMGLPEKERARRIVAWANWWFRSEKFVPGDSSFEEVWFRALHKAAWTRSVSLDGPPPEGEDARQRIRKRLIPIITAPFEDQYQSIVHEADRVREGDFLQGYHYYRNRWLGSAQHHALDKVLQTANIPFVNKIVAFGVTDPVASHRAIVADVNPQNPAPHHATRLRHKHCFTQYAILMRMAEVFESQHGQHVEVYVQDPSLQDSTRVDMARLGFRFMDGEYDCQEGFTKIDDNTLVYDAIIFTNIFQIYMKYALPAAVMTPLLDKCEREGLQGDYNSAIIQDDEIENGEPILWSRPPLVGGATESTFNILKNYYHEISLIDKHWLKGEAQRSDMTAAEIQRAAMVQMDEESKQYSTRITDLTRVAVGQLGPESSFPNKKAYEQAVNYTGIVVEYDNGSLPPTLHDLNCSEQSQLGLYVRKQGVLEASGR